LDLFVNLLGEDALDHLRELFIELSCVLVSMVQSVE
jgi:hypothetical protein